MMRRASTLSLVAIVTALLAPPALAEDARPVRPNIVLILVDDAGFSDFGAFGGEARTPNIDRLAETGVRFTNYHTSPLCAPSRAMLLTGVDAHRTGVATIPEVLPPEHRNRPGYTMRLEPGVVTVADRLRAAGYRTYMTGKWHLGHGERDLPNHHGFDRSFVLDASGADNWEQRPYMPYYRSADWFEDGAPTTLPEDFYSSEFLVDRMIDYIDGDDRQDAPFFAYVAFQAVHIPVQAPREFTEHYAGVYDAGWHALALRRAERLRANGLVNDDAPLARMHASLRAWESLSEDERRLLAKSMEVHAGMLEAMDHHIGRLVSHLEARGLVKDTLFVVTSDNGPEPSDPLAQAGFEQWMSMQGYTRRLADLGERGSFVYIGPEFASATAAPGSLFKFYTTEGGLRVPLIVSGPGVLPDWAVHAFSFVTDIAPTLLEVAGAAPAAATGGSPPVTGRSLAAVLAGGSEPVYPADATVGVEVSGNAALFRGEWKIVRNRPPFGDGAWHLYDILRDPGETTDLAEAHADLFREMQADYAAYAKEVGVLELPADYDVQAQIGRNVREKQVAYYAPRAGFAAFVLIALALAVWRWRRGRVRL